MTQLRKQPFWQSQALMKKPQVLLISDNVLEHLPKMVDPNYEESILETNRQSTNISLPNLDAAWQLFNPP